MMKELYSIGFSRVQNKCLVFLLILIGSIKVEAQNLSNLIESNHRIYCPAGVGPFPTIIAIPGCSGVSLDGIKTDMGRIGDEGDRLFRRHYSRMAKRLQEEGFLVLLLDYLSAEGVPNTCGWEIHPRRVGEYIKEAISFVRTVPQVDSNRINLIGWSHGGEGVLLWLSNLDEEPIGVQSVITVYPGCSASNSWNSSIQLLMILGEADDIALPGICNNLVKSLPITTNVQVKSYPDARHGFDITEGPTKLTVGDGLTIGRNPEAGFKAWQEILKFLSVNN